MKKDQFALGVYEVSPVEGRDGFAGSRFPKMSVTPRNTSVPMNRLFRSQTAFMPMVEEGPEVFSPEVPLAQLTSTRMFA